MDFPREAVGELLHCLWLIETARSRVLEWRGHPESAVRAAERAAILERHARTEGVELRSDVSVAHTEWMKEVAGPPEDTAALGWFFLQRLGAFTDLHVRDAIPEADRHLLIELSAPDAKEVNDAIGAQGLPPAPPPEWPDAPRAELPGDSMARFAIIGDPHMGIRVSQRFIPVVVDDINREGVDFSVIIGDLTQTGKEEQFTEAREVFDKLAAPYILTVGNHDMWGYMTERPMGLERFAETFQRKPYGVQDANGVRVIVIDSADPTASPFPPFDILAGGFTDEPNESVPGGKISEEVAEWMSAIGAAGPTLIFLHHPPYPYPGHPPIVFGLDEPATKLLADLVERTGAWGVFCGHTHRSALYEFAGVPFIEVPSSKEWPFGYGIVEVSQDGWAYNLMPVSDKRLVEKASVAANQLVRRYARGPAAARAYSWKRRDTLDA